MDAEDAAAKLPTPSPTTMTASAIGIVVPPKEDGPVDPNTGLVKKVTVPPTVDGEAPTVQ